MFRKEEVADSARISHITGGGILTCEIHRRATLAQESVLLGNELVSVLRRRAKNLLDFPDDNDACEHLLHLLTVDGLGGVPYGTVGRHHRLWGQVVCIVTSFGTLGAGTEPWRYLRTSSRQRRKSEKQIHQNNTTHHLKR